MSIKRIKFEVGDITQTHADGVLLWQDALGNIDKNNKQKLEKEWRIDLPSPITSNIGEVYTITVPHSMRRNNGNPTNLVFYGIVDDHRDMFHETIRKVLAQLALITQAYSTVRDIAIPLDDKRFRLSDLEMICSFIVSNFLQYANQDCNLELYVSDLTMAKHLENLMDKGQDDSRKPKLQLIERYADGKNREEFLSRKFYLLRGFARTDLERIEPRLSLLAEEDNGKSDPIFKSAPVGSFIFKTSSMVMEDNLVIVAFGQVIENDNGIVKVTWISEGFHAAIKNRNYPLQSMFEIFMQYEKEDIYGLIVKDFKSLERETSMAESIKYKASNTMTVNMVNDVDIGEDYLEIGEDVSAFSRIVALRSFRPPLAIALCGRWGSGKSFFMEKMIRQIDGLINEDQQGLFCQGVAHIRFNAWSYLDSNLWAGMVTKIFGGLNEYITRDQAGDEVKGRLRAELEKQIGLAKEHALKMGDEKTQLEISFSRLKEERQKADERLKSEIKKLTTQSFKDFVTTVDKEFDVTKEIDKALDANDTVTEVKVYVKEHFPKELWDGNGWGLKELSRGYAFMLDFFNRKRLLANTRYLAVILLVLWIVPELLADSVAMLKSTKFRFSQQFFTTIAVIGVALDKAIASYRRISPVFSALWKIRRNHSQRFEETKAKWEQQQREIEATIQKEQAELTRVEEQLGAVEIELSAVEFRLANRLGSEAFANFIHQKTSSDDYRKHQGIIATIRDDFETLSNLFDHYTTEIPTWKQEGDLDRPLERIVLYIDDLDRCSEERVVEVLQAVHLIMAFKLFVVVVGIDPVRVKSALEKNLLKDGQEEDGGIAFEYLEKIFQIPFHLKLPTDEVAKEMLGKLLFSSPFEQREIVETAQVEEGPAGVEETVFTEDVLEVKVIPVEKTGKAMDVQSVENLVLTDSEIERATAFTELVGTSPRTLKRFANTYRVIRAHGSLVYPKGEDLGLHHDVVMFLLALSMGRHKKYYTGFSRLIETQGTTGVVEHLLTASLGSVFYKEKTALLNFMQQGNMKSLLEAKKELFVEHNKLVKRFSFTTIDE